MTLAEYRRKRDPSRTPEPFDPDPLPSVGPTSSGTFAVHLHDATQRHYDLRLEVGGVLLSFAVPKGFSLDPSQKHLAVRTEDHPLSYVDYEGVIPEGQYGAGAMILWDRGRVRYLEGPAEEELERGKLDLELYGHKLRGRYALVRLKDSPDNWLLFKKSDAWSANGRDLGAEQPRSILSGLTVEELARAPAIAAELERAAEALGAPEGDVDPRSMIPMLCSSGEAPLADPAWLYELKLDGVRLLAKRSGKAVALINRRHRVETERYPEVTRAVAALPVDVVLDGEIVAFDERGYPSFQRLGRRIHLERPRDVRLAMTEVPVLYVAFDLLSLGRRDLRRLPLRHRKELLGRLLSSAGVLRKLDYVEGDGRALLAFCKSHRLEGLVAKRLDAIYHPGPKRYDAWVKMKCERDDEFVVVGWTVGERGRGRLGALDLASYRGDKLVYRGKVGSGLDERTIDALLEILAPLVVDERPDVEGKFPSAPRGRTYVRPEVVVSVRFLGWSDEGSIRHPVFRGIRDDKPASECRAAPPTELEAPRDEGGTRVAAPPAERTAPKPRAEPRISLSNPQKLLWPDEGITKQHLWDYYDAVAPVLLPYLHDRPIVLVRYPDGIRGKSFFQWNTPEGLPPMIGTLRIVKEDEKREVNVFLIENRESLLYLANLACIPIHVLASRADSIDACDFLTLDFDVKNASLAEAVILARTLQRLLDAMGLPGYPKTSGQTGLHVLVPLGPGISFDTARALADLLGRLLCAEHPSLATMERTVSKRGARVYVDTGQTGRSRSIVAPYSVRATPGARVSTPLRWDEVVPELDPGRFTMATVPTRIAEVGDPMADLLSARPDVPRAVRRLEQLSKHS